MPRLRVVGGCCGTDHRHLEAICRALLAVPSA
jgi:methionine synthase I (cobalamin-dependent)